MRAQGTITLGVSEFKRRCLELLERSRRRGDEIIITKHGRPLARVVPIPEAMATLRGRYAGALELPEDLAEISYADEWAEAR